MSSEVGRTSWGCGRTRSPRVLGYPAPVPFEPLDEAVLRAVIDLRWGALTAVMTVASAWWVKGVAIAALGGIADLRRRPRAIPWTPLLATSALVVASLASGVLKDALDRARPAVAEPGISALVPIPADASLPSGHAATAAAAAGVVALLHPRLRLPLAALVALIGLSRVYLGVHYPSDVLAGLALGLAIAWAIVALARRAAQLSSPRSSSSSAASASSSADSPPMPLIAPPPLPSSPSRPWVGSAVSGAPGPAPEP